MRRYLVIYEEGVSLVILISSCDFSECVTFSGKRKKGENDKKMITLNDNINDNTHPVQGKIITQK